MNNTEPAFPRERNPNLYPGLTKREYFAAMAMQGIVGRNDYSPRDEGKWIVEISVEIADKLLKQLSK